MAEVLEVREVSFAVHDLDEAQAKFYAMGFPHTPPVEEATNLVQVRLTSMPVGDSSLSLMESLGDTESPISRFLKRRGEGIFSITLLVDDVEGICDKWRKAGVEFVLDEPIELRDTKSVGLDVPVIRGNWTRPSTLHGIVIELQEFRDESGAPFYPSGRAETY
jgi:methylmalonyl-CoA/ethylmalonyl-CoA epimerase